MTKLRRGTPSIELNPSTGRTTGASAGIPANVNTIVVGVWMLQPGEEMIVARRDRKSTRLNSSHLLISHAVFCFKKKKISDKLHHLVKCLFLTSHISLLNINV